LITEATGRRGVRLDTLAFVAAAANAVASLVMVLVLRPGLPGFGTTDADRLSYIQTHVVEWRLGWLSWNAAAITLLSFFVALSQCAKSDAPLVARVALLCATAGLAADLAAEALIMGLQPTATAQLFPVLERATLLLTGYLGNGLYSVCGGLLTWSLRAMLPRRLVLLAVPLWGAGLILSMVTMLDWIAGEIVVTGIVMTLFVLWTLLVGMWARTSAS
jgi:hypothetical protein